MRPLLERSVVLISIESRRLSEGKCSDSVSLLEVLVGSEFLEFIIMNRFTRFTRINFKTHQPQSLGQQRMMEIRLS